jgi:hypothetical protein
MHLRNILILAHTFGTYASPQIDGQKNVPAKGDNGQVGGVFGLSFGGGSKPPSKHAYLNSSQPTKLINY